MEMGLPLTGPSEVETDSGGGIGIPLSPITATSQTFSPY